MELIKKFKDKRPEYDAKYKDLILGFTIQQGGTMGRQTDEEKWLQGKYFSYQYEMYMYAALLGMKNEYRIPIERGTERAYFNEIRNWIPQEIADYIVMGLLAKSDIDFTLLEEMQVEEVEKELNRLRSLLEEYANGGLDMIRAKREEDPSFFSENENCFLDLLDRSKTWKV